MNTDQLADGIVYYVVFLFSTTLHEAAHAWAAKRGGDLTAYQGGQVSLSPVPHIRREPFGMVLLPLLSVATTGWPFGFASAPYDPAWAQRHPRRAALMSLAGPASNLLLVLIAAALIRGAQAAGWVYAPDHPAFGHIARTQLGGLWPGVTFMLGAFFSLNLLLAAFNMIPVPPLDGSGAIPILLSEGAGRRYQRFLWGTPVLMLLGIFAAWRLFDYLFPPIFLAALNLLYPGSDYIMR